MSEKAPLNKAMVCRILKRQLKCYCVAAEHRIKNKLEVLGTPVKSLFKYNDYKVDFPNKVILIADCGIQILITLVCINQFLWRNCSTDLYSRNKSTLDFNVSIRCFVTSTSICTLHSVLIVHVTAL